MTRITARTVRTPEGTKTEYRLNGRPVARARLESFVGARDR